MGSRPANLDLGQLFRLMADCAPVMVWVADARRRRTYSNQRWLDFTGRAFRDELGSRWTKSIHPDDRVSASRVMDQAIGERRGFESEYRLLRADGEYRRVRDTGAPIFGDEGLFFGYVGSCIDITDRRRAENALRRREREFQRLASSIPDVIVRIDSALRCVYANPAIEHVFGRKPGEFIGLPLADAGLSPDISTPLLEAVRATFAERREHQFRFDAGEGDHLRHYEGRVIAEHGEAGEIDSVLVISYDVTLRTRQDRERAALLVREQGARANAESAALARDQFLAIVSHELRSPLNAIKSWAHVLENHLGEANPGARRALDGIMLGVDQQVHLIEDLLDATRVMSGNLGLAKQAVALRPLLEGITEALEHAASDRGLEIVTEFGIDAHEVDGDPDRLRQVFRNLVLNAIKYASRKITVSASVSNGMACIVVHDDGRGISPDFLPHVFEAFRQAETRVSRRGQEGLGLGLLIVRQVVALHGGHATVDSPGDNLGTTFRILLPLRTATSTGRTLIDAPPAAETSLPTLAGLRIALVEDQGQAREAVAALLTQFGAVVAAFGSGREATDWLEACAPEAYPDVLVCDIAMPGEDGYATLKRIRAWEKQQSRHGAQGLPAIALTAFSERADRLRALAEGFQMHVSKPVAPAELVVVISSVTRGIRS